MKVTTVRKRQKQGRKKDDEPPVVDNNPGSIVNDPGNAAANETALEAHEGIAAALIQIAMMEV